MADGLYKFLADPNSVELVLNGAIKFSPICELNDPSELSPTLVVDEVRASLVRLQRDGYRAEDVVHLHKQERLLQRLAPAFRAISAPRTAAEATALVRSRLADSIPLLELLLERTAREMSSKVGLFCLSGRFDSLPMWAHYAANAAGLVVEFRDLAGVFDGDETGILNQPIAVRYQKERTGVTFDPRSHEGLFFDKFQDWSYEQEVRVVLPLAECRRETVGARTVYLYDIPPHHVSRVILGWNISPEKAALVRAVAARQPTPVEVVQASFRRGRVEVG